MKKRLQRMGVKPLPFGLNRPTVFQIYAAQHGGLRLKPKAASRYRVRGPILGSDGRYHYNIRKVSKKGGTGRAGGRGEGAQGSVGSAASKRAKRAKAGGTRGAFPLKEKRKQKK